MHSIVGFLRSQSRAVALSLSAVGLAGCGSDTTRFNDSPFASRPSSAEVTGAVPASRAPVARVEQSQLPPPSGGYYSQPVSSAPVGVSGGGRGMASYAPASGQEVTGSVDAPPRPAPVARTQVPPTVTPSATTTVAAAPPAGPAVHVVAPGDTLSKISRRYGKPIADIAKANNIPPHATLKIGDRITIPGAHSSKASPKESAKLAQAKPLAAPAAKSTTAKPAAPAKPQAGEPAQSASVVAPAADGPVLAGTSKSVAEPLPSFRWPVKGRVIAGFGPKTNGQQNDGINLAVPEGTPVKAAEDGVVAYAGNELKGYGNLLLVRHSNGYVTAYAHAKELLVKRGDQVKRGQVIAQSGQTGNVDAPQLHFEVRKGPSPLDPLPLLSGG